MKNSFIIISLLIVYSTNAFPQGLNSNPTINSIFNKQEVADLNTILNFFNNEICLSENQSKDSINKCYVRFSKRLYAESQKGDINPKFPFSNQLKLYEQIDDSTFSQIWKLSKYHNGNSQTEKVGLELNPFGKYADYLKELGKEYKLIDNYYNDLMDAGDLSPLAIADLLVDYSDYNISDIRIQLVFAIHYLTLNDKNLRD